MIDSGEPRVPQKGEVKRRSEPPIGGRVNSLSRARVGASNGFRREPHCGGARREIKTDGAPMRRGSPGVTKRRGVCGESRVQARGKGNSGGSGDGERRGTATQRAAQGG